MKPELKLMLVNAIAAIMNQTDGDTITSLAGLSDDVITNMADQYKVPMPSDSGQPAQAPPAAQPTHPQPVSTITNEQSALLEQLLAEKQVRLTNKREQIKTLHPQITNVENLDENACDALLSVNHRGATNYALAGGARPVTNAAYTAPSVFLANSEQGGSNEG